MSQKNSFKKAFSVTLPVLMGYFPAGVAFGVLATVAGLPWWLSLFLSLVTYSGAAQYAAIPLIAGNAGVLSMSVNTLGINLRHIFYALPLIDALPDHWFKKNYCLFALTDECFSVMTTLPPIERKAIFFKAAFLMQTYWVLSSVVGILLADLLNKLVPNLDFALACLFVVLWYEQVKRNQLVWPTILALTLFIIALVLLPQHALMVALALCVIAILGKEATTKDIIKDEVQDEH